MLRSTSLLLPVEVAVPDPAEDFPLHVLEDDENVPPRPEEELADLERSEPDPRRP